MVKIGLNYQTEDAGFATDRNNNLSGRSEVTVPMTNSSNKSYPGPVDNVSYAQAIVNLDDIPAKKPPKYLRPTKKTIWIQNIQLKL